MMQRFIRKNKNLIQQAQVSTLLIEQLLRRFESYIPWNTYSLRALHLAAILNDTAVNRRKNILEFGAGMSTLFLAKIIKLNKLECRVISIEAREDWIEHLQNILKNEGLIDSVEFIKAPIRPNQSPEGAIEWYCEDTLKHFFKELDARFDSVIVDGPVGKNSLNRYPALPFLEKNNLLDSTFIAFLDDTNRKSEKKILSLWETELGYSFQPIGDSMSYYVSNREHFLDPRPC
jgi:hypothetical protein